MSVTVTLNVFSGRPNPAWELSRNEISELTDRLRALRDATLLKPPGIAGRLGYAGFSINAVREKALDPHIYIHQGIVDQDRFELNRLAHGSGLEQWLLGTAKQAVTAGIVRFVTTELARSSTSPTSTGPLLVPPYDPGKWNNDPNIRTMNNCYNYANDKITNTVAQPGRGSGAIFTFLECADVSSASQRDGQIMVGPPSTTPKEGHFIALVIWPQNDFHWYRQDDNTNWSHKPGQTAARNYDNSNAAISDPRNCDRGPYTDFCGFYHCIPDATQIL